MEHNPLLRPSMAAIAAALALSATPAFAQDASAAAQPPVVLAPPTIEPIEAAPVDTTIEPSPMLSQAAPEAAPAPLPVPTMQPIIHQPTPADLRAARTEITPAAPRPTPTPVARAIVAPAAPTPVAAAPVETASIPAPVAAPVPVQRTTAMASGIDEDALPYVGAGAAALLLLGGAAALTRRRRRDDALPVERYESERVLDLDPADRVIAIPALARTAKPRSAKASATALPNGFDLSRFGRHTQAAYRGQTADNPSLSLRRRLKRASFFDGRERIAAEAAMEAAPVRVPVAAAARTAKAPAVADEQIVIRPRAVRKRPSLRPSFAR